MTARRYISVVACLPIFLLSSAATVHAGKAKVDKALQEAIDKKKGPQRVIIRVKPGKRPAVKKKLAGQGDTLEAEHKTINAVAFRLDEADVTALADNPDVESMSLDVPVAADTSLTVGDYTQAFRGTLGLDSLGLNGGGIGIAVIDSGIKNLPDFEKRIVAFYEFKDGKPGKKIGPKDDYGHGTHVAGLIGASGKLTDREFVGVAPAVRFIGLKVLDSKGQGTTVDVINAIEFVITNQAKLRIDVINLSLGHPIYEPASTDPLVQAVEAAVRAGIVVVVSAGNFGTDQTSGGDGLGPHGYAGITSPGNAPSAITVGALDSKSTVTRSDDSVASYSSSGPTWYDALSKPDLVAPGNGLVSDGDGGSEIAKDYPLVRIRSSNGKTLLRLSGTSMAAAVTSGVIALVLQASRDENPGAPPLAPNAVKALLQFTAIPVLDSGGAAYDALTQGTGSLNAVGAVALADAIDLSAPSGEYWLGTGVQTSSVIGGETLDWSQGLIWDSKIVWGNVVFLNDAAWSKDIVWGDKIVWSDSVSATARNIVWGANIVWGFQDVWATNVVWGASNLTVEGAKIVWGNLTPDTCSGNNIVWGLVVF